MTVKEVAQAINENRIIKYDGALYRIGGYVLRKEKGKKLYSVILYDQVSNERSTVQVPMDKI